MHLSIFLITEPGKLEHYSVCLIKSILAFGALEDFSIYVFSPRGLDNFQHETLEYYRANDVDFITAKLNTTWGFHFTLYQTRSSLGHIWNGMLKETCYFWILILWY